MGDKAYTAPGAAAAASMARVRGSRATARKNAHRHKAAKEASGAEEGEAMAYAYKDKVVPAMEALRAPVDQLEMIVDKEYWPMPSYGDLMFEV